MDLSSLWRAASAYPLPPLLPQHEPAYELPILSNSPRASGSAMPSHAVGSLPHHSISLPGRKTRSPARGPMLALERQEKQLQAQLQSLLDAQSEGLLAGLSSGGGGGGAASTSDGRSTPSMSTSNVRGSRTTPVRQPVAQPIGLRAARRGILEAMHDLALLKHQESLAVEADLRDRHAVLRQVDDWHEQRRGLETEIRHIQDGQDGRRVVELQQQDSSLQTDIHELETRLHELRAQQLHLRAELSQLENSVQAKLSSYQASLSILHTQVHSFLVEPPPQLASTHASTAPTLFPLPPHRRTLDMAREHWEAERRRQRERRRLIQLERDALEDGSVVWQDVVTQVTTFERRLRRNMQALPSRPPRHALDAIRASLSDMDAVISRLQGKLEQAETRDWKLLVCCIGAEVEAFRQGRHLLHDAVQASTGRQHSSAARNHDQTSDHGLRELHDEPDGFHDAVEKSPVDHAHQDHDPDPDPDLMISHPDRNQ